MPAYSSLCLAGASNKFMIATEMGIWGSDNGGSSWAELNLMNADPATWHPRVATYELAEQTEFANADASGGGYQGGSVVYTGTHGRGTFRSTSLSNYFPTKSSFVAQHSGSIQVYPNPASDQAFVAYNAEINSKVNVQIYSLNGSLMSTQVVAVNSGTNRIALNIANLAKGGYIVYLNDGGKKASSTFIKQ
jgi:hypothetical protein